MITIEDGVLYVDGAEVQELPALPFDATIRVWAVPTEYMSSGYYVDVWMDGTTKSEPASAQRDTTYIGSVRYTHDETTRIAYEVEQGKMRLKEWVTTKRSEVMAGGIEVGGIFIGTTDQDHARLSQVVVGAPLAGLTDESEVSFKALNGFARVTIGQIKAIVGAIGLHWQACFAAEEDHWDAIDKLKTLEQIEGYDINAGWPGTEPETA